MGAKGLHFKVVDTRPDQTFGNAPGRLLKNIQRIQLGSVVQQQPGNFVCSVVGSTMQSGPAVLAHRIHVGTPLNKQLGYFQGILVFLPGRAVLFEGEARCHHQRCRILLGGQQRVRACLQQGARQAEIGGRSRQHQGGDAKQAHLGCNGG